MMGGPIMARHCTAPFLARPGTWAPWLMTTYVVSFLDRANIGFAKQALQTYEGIHERIYALAAGSSSVTRPRSYALVWRVLNSSKNNRNRSWKSVSTRDNEIATAGPSPAAQDDNLCMMQIHDSGH
jgi:hypothetical protein